MRKDCVGWHLREWLCEGFFKYSGNIRCFVLFFQLLFQKATPTKTGQFVCIFLGVVFFLNHGCRKFRCKKMRKVAIKPKCTNNIPRVFFWLGCFLHRIFILEFWSHSQFKAIPRNKCRSLSPSNILPPTWIFISLKKEKITKISQNLWYFYKPSKI